MCMPQVQQPIPAHQTVSPAMQSMIHQLFWALFLIFGPIGYCFVPPLEDASLGLTIGAWCQLLAASIYWLVPRGGIRGDSADFCLLFIIALCLRLSMTCKFNGYLPGDETGDGPYQMMEGLTLLVALRGLVRTGLKPKEVITVSMLLAISSVGAYYCFGFMNNRPWADRIYAASVYTEVLAWLCLTRSIIMAGKNRAMYGSFLLPMVAQGALRTHFWWMAHPEMSVKEPVYYQAEFPDVLIVVHAVVTSLAAICGLYVLTAGRAATTAPTPQFEMANPLLQAAPVAGIPAVIGSVVPSVAGLPSLPAPAGSGAKCFAPTSATYENGILQVQYEPVF